MDFDSPVMLRGNKDSFLSRIICLCQARLVEPIVREQWREEAGKRGIVPFSRIHLTEHRVYSTLRTGSGRERRAASLNGGGGRKDDFAF